MDNGEPTAAAATVPPPQPPPTKPTSLARPLLAGALAGTSVDILLYPLDTLKTRLQSSRGFLASGGFRGVYAGLGSVALGSAPSGALFFAAYETAKARLARDAHLGPAAAQMLAASMGEVGACAVRVPVEVVKQRTQAGQHASSLAALEAIVARHYRPHGDVGGGAAARGGARGRRIAALGNVLRELYTGWGVTVLREVPFTVIQFPLWEALRGWLAARKGRRTATGAESAAAGSVSGALAAGLTTPLDVVKTRMMLAAREGVGGDGSGGGGEHKLRGEATTKGVNEVGGGGRAGAAAAAGDGGRGRATTATAVARGIWKDEGPRAFFKGIVPRTVWISIGGAVFLGSYQWCWNLLEGVV